MLILTLPTVVSCENLRFIEQIVSNPLVDGVRYNSGGDSPFTSRWIMQQIRQITDRHSKLLYVDLEGRQMRIARWSPFSKGSVILNRDFSIKLPGLIHFRRAGWFKIVNSAPEERKIFFQTIQRRQEYYLGESQSVNILSDDLEVKGYLNGYDKDYLRAAVECGVNRFMLSFFEKQSDIDEFMVAYYASGGGSLPAPELILKIESVKGVEYVEKKYSQSPKTRLMAARDDLFLSFKERRKDFLEALKLIVEKDAYAIVASKLMSGLENHGELSMGDMVDLVLMNKFGYRSFMWQDELTHNFREAIANWKDVAVPILNSDKY